MSQNRATHPLHQPFTDLLSLQQQITSIHSKYFSKLFEKLLGTDTIPFMLITAEGKILRLSNAEQNIETNYFRIEAVEEGRILVSLLRAFNFEGEKATNLTEVARLEKTTTTVNIQLHQLSAIQLVDPRMLSATYYIESKW